MPSSTIAVSQCQSNFKTGKIEPSPIPRVGSAILAVKKDGSRQFYVDYGKLNNDTMGIHIHFLRQKKLLPALVKQLNGLEICEVYRRKTAFSDQMDRLFSNE